VIILLSKKDQQTLKQLLETTEFKKLLPNEKVLAALYLYQPLCLSAIAKKSRTDIANVRGALLTYRKSSLIEFKFTEEQNRTKRYATYYSLTEQGQATFEETIFPSICLSIQ
jgi:predicted transcriptional regulator with HTH domain